MRFVPHSEAQWFLPFRSLMLDEQKLGWAPYAWSSPRMIVWCVYSSRKVSHHGTCSVSYSVAASYMLPRGFGTVLLSGV